MRFDHGCRRQKRISVRTGDNETSPDAVRPERACVDGVFDSVRGRAEVFSTKWNGESGTTY